jgi:hypothetical protein
VRSKEEGRFSDSVAGRAWRRMSHGLTTHAIVAALMRPPCSWRWDDEMMARQDSPGSSSIAALQHAPAFSKERIRL